jgi:hypothetical protein
VKLHLRDEDHELYPRLLRHDDERVRGIASSFQMEMGGLAGEFTKFYGEWIAAHAIDSDRAQFFVEADRILGALFQRMDREDNQLYSLADDATASPRAAGE